MSPQSVIADRQVIRAVWRCFSPSHSYLISCLQDIPCLFDVVWEADLKEIWSCALTAYL